MAQRRMFSLSVLDTDDFLAMPTSARLLYCDLSMRADDDGFVNSPKKIMRMTGASEDDFKVLIAKNYIIPFDSGVCVIRHWFIHNLIRSDRKVETEYKQELSSLHIVDNKYEKTNDNQVTTICQPVGCQMSAQVRLGKDRLGKDKIYSSSEDERLSFFDLFWKKYPRKQSKAKAMKAWKSKSLDKIKDDILLDLDTRAQYSPPNGWLGLEAKYIPLPTTYLNAERWNDEFTDDKPIKAISQEPKNEMQNMLKDM